MTAGQSKAGMSSLWIGFECVTEREPKRRPWKPDLNERTERWGLPGAAFFMQDDICNVEDVVS